MSATPRSDATEAAIYAYLDAAGIEYEKRELPADMPSWERLARALERELAEARATNKSVGDFSRERFEERVYADYFIRGIRRNPSPPKPKISGCLDYVPAEDVQDKATFCERDGESYKREDVAAMWHGWQLAAKPSNERNPL